MLDTHSDIYIEKLTLKNVDLDNYVKWVQDDDVMQFIESRFDKSGLNAAGIKRFIKTCRRSPSEELFGIFVDPDIHIGNIKLGDIDTNHKFAYVGIFIGDSSCHGKGYGTRAIRLITKYAFDKLKLNKVVAGVYAPNIASRRAFVKAGYNSCGYLCSHRWYKGAYVGQFLFEKVNINCEN